MSLIIWAIHSGTLETDQWQHEGSDWDVSIWMISDRMDPLTSGFSPRLVGDRRERRQGNLRVEHFAKSFTASPLTSWSRKAARPAFPSPRSSSLPSSHTRTQENAFLLPLANQRRLRQEPCRGLFGGSWDCRYWTVGQISKALQKFVGKLEGVKIWGISLVNISSWKSLIFRLQQVSGTKLNCFQKEIPFLSKRANTNWTKHATQTNTDFQRRRNPKQQTLILKFWESIIISVKGSVEFNGILSLMCLFLSLSLAKLSLRDFRLIY